MRLRKNIFFIRNRSVASIRGLTIESETNDESLYEAATQQNIKRCYRFLYLVESLHPYSSRNGWIGTHLYWLSGIHRATSHKYKPGNESSPTSYCYTQLSADAFDNPFEIFFNQRYKVASN